MTLLSSIDAAFLLWVFIVVAAVAALVIFHWVLDPLVRQISRRMEHRRAVKVYLAQRKAPR